MAMDKETFEMLLKVRADIAELKKARSEVDGFKNEMSKIGQAAQKTKSLLSGLGLGIGSFLSIGGIVSAVRSAVGEMAALNKEARQLGISASGLYELQRAATRAGVGMGDVNQSLTQIRLKASAAASGESGAKKAFDALGIAVQDANGNLKDTSQILDEIIARAKGGASLSALAGVVGGEKAGKFSEIAKSSGKKNSDIDRAAADAERLENAMQNLSDSTIGIKTRIVESTLDLVNIAKGIWNSGPIDGIRYAADQRNKQELELKARKYREQKAKQEAERLALEQRRETIARAIADIDEKDARTREQMLEDDTRLARLAERRDAAVKALAQTNKNSLDYAAKYGAMKEAQLALDVAQDAYDKKQVAAEKAKTAEAAKQAALKKQVQEKQDELLVEIALVKYKADGNTKLVERIETFKKLRAYQKEILSLQNLEGLSVHEINLKKGEALSIARKRLDLEKQLLQTERDRANQSEREKQAKRDLYEMQINLAKAAGDIKKVELLELAKEAEDRFAAGGYATQAEATKATLALKNARDAADKAAQAATQASNSARAASSGASRRPSFMDKGTRNTLSRLSQGSRSGNHIAPSRRAGETWAMADARYQKEQSAREKAAFTPQQRTAWNELSTMQRSKFTKAQFIGFYNANFDDLGNRKDIGASVSAESVFQKQQELAAQAKAQASARAAAVGVQNIPLAANPPPALKARANTNRVEEYLQKNVSATADISRKIEETLW